MALPPAPISVPPMTDAIPHWRTVELGKLNNKFSYAKDPSDKAWFAIKYGERVLEVVDVTVIGFDNALLCGAATVPENDENKIGLYLTGGTPNATYRLRVGVITGGGDVIYSLVHLDVVFVGMAGGTLLTGNVTDGPQIIAGAASGLVPMLAGAAITAHHVLMSDLNGGVIEADPTVPGYVFMGIALQNALAGAAVPVAEIGAVVEPTWDWTPGSPLYAIAGGLMSHTAPTSGVSQQIAVAISATAILIQAQTPIDLGGA